MNEKMVTGWLNVYGSWMRAVTGLASAQWGLIDTQYTAGMKLLEALAPRRVAPSTFGGPAGPESLEQRAAERMHEGRAPPREIYQVQNRGRIDWSRFPDWARPADPELFDGCSHEG